MKLPKLSDVWLYAQAWAFLLAIIGVVVAISVYWPLGLAASAYGLYAFFKRH